MSKIRVHELAKEFGLDNKEVIDRLQAAGIAVKTHSSSVYEDEARAVLSKGAAETPKKPARKRPGMMIVRKKKAAEPASELEEAAAHQAETEAEEAAAAFEAPEEAEELSAAVPETAEEAVEPSSEVPVAEEAEAAPAPVEAAEQAVQAEAEAEAVQAADGDEGPAPEEEQEPEAAAKKDQKPGVSAKVVRMIDREKLLERVPQRRLGGAPGEQKSQKFGKVTELRVVTDPFGRGREMLDVSRDKRGKGRPARKTRAPTKREMMEMRERAMHPSRLKRKKGIKRSGKKTEVTQPKASKRVIKMKETIALADFAHQLGIKTNEIVAKLMSLGSVTSINQGIDFDTAQLIAEEYEYTVESVAFAEEEYIGPEEVEENPEDLEPRPPVVTVMGHVDHGKTSLLDYIRKSRVAAGEAGGITQHIGAYQVTLPNKAKITFLDTPGHAAFTSMRARGAQVTDIVVLVVAADDGVMPQTEEAIRHAQAAGVPIIVAVNKIDRPEAQPDRVMQELTKFELISEAWGGETLFVNTSATKGTGIKELLEAIHLQAEMLELKANPKRPAVGVVVEAKLDKGRGPVATVLIEAGTLNTGDAVVVGEACGRIRALADHQRKQVKKAGPAMPVEITGQDQVPAAGDAMNVVDNVDGAKEVAEHRREQKRAQEATASGPKMSLEDLMARMEGKESLELRVVLKADVQGSIEAVRDALVKLSTEEVKVTVLLSGVGGVKESDIVLASASEGIVLGFNVRPDPNAIRVAEREGVEIRTYKVIYEMVDDVKKAMEGLLEPERQEKVIGHAEVRDLFRVSKVGTIAGCRVIDGKAMRSARIRVVRDSVPVYEGKVGSLKRFKDDAREVESGMECGVSVEGFNDVKNGDVLEFFQVEEVRRSLAAPAAAERPDSPPPEAHP
jgi:translation initiation factor IF-2